MRLYVTGGVCARLVSFFFVWLIDCNFFLLLNVKISYDKLSEKKNAEKRRKVSERVVSSI